MRAPPRWVLSWGGPAVGFACLGFARIPAGADWFGCRVRRQPADEVSRRVAVGEDHPVSDTTTAATGTIGGVMTPADDGGAWVPLPMAAELAGVSLRTFQRRAAGGLVRTRTGPDGRREAWVSRHVRADATPSVVAQDAPGGLPGGGVDATGGRDSDATGGVLAVAVARQAVVLAERRAEELGGMLAEARTELRRVRRAGSLAWAGAAAGFVLAGLAAVWGVRAAEEAKGRAAAADATAAVLVRQAASERDRADQADRERRELLGRVLAERAPAERPERWGPWAPERLTEADGDSVTIP